MNEIAAVGESPTCDRVPTSANCIIDLPLQTRADVRLQAESIDAEARTVEVVWSTGVTVRRRDLWTGKRYDEVFSLEPRHVDLSRLNGGAPLLNTHGAFDLAGVIGVVERAWITKSSDSYEGRATVRFSGREDVEPLWQDVRAGIIRNVSVGYVVRAYEVSELAGDRLAAGGAVGGAGRCRRWRRLPPESASHALPSHRRTGHFQHQPGAGRPATGEHRHGSTDDGGRRRCQIPPGRRGQLDPGARRADGGP